MARSAPIRGHGPHLAALALTMLLPSLGTSIANVALPSLAASFGAELLQVQLVVLSYLIAVTTLIVGAGRLGDMFGRRTMLLTGIALFSAASLGCALAPSLWLLVTARALQGAGAALMMSLTVAAVADAGDGAKTGSAMGLLGTISAAGTALGPSLGGVLVGWAGWPSVFALLSLLGAVSFAVAWRLLPRSSVAEAAPARFDGAGFVLLGLALGAYALWTSSIIAPPVCAGVAVAALALFVIVERRVTQPLVSIAELGDRRLSGGLAALGLVTSIVMATLVVGPFYLTGSAGLGAAQAGLVMSIGPLVAALVGVPAGRLVDRSGARIAMLAGLLTAMAGCVLMASLPAVAGISGYVGGLVLITAGYALFQAANAISVMSAAAPERRGVMSGLLGLARNLGLITGASAMGAVFALASQSAPALGLPAGGLVGLQATFALGAGLAAISLWLILPSGGARRAPAWERARR